MAAEDKWQATPFWYACSWGHHATAMLLLASCDGADLWRADVCGWTPLARCMVLPAIGGAGKAAIAKAILATPGFMTPLPHVIAAVQHAEEWANDDADNTPAHPLVLRAIAQQKTWLRRRTLLLLRMLTDKRRATWRCRCTDCTKRRHKGPAVEEVGVEGMVAAHQQVTHCRDNGAKCVCRGCRVGWVWRVMLARSGL